MSINYEQLADDIVRLVGGTGNVRSVTHCMTRVRFVLNDFAVANGNKEEIEKLDGVLDVVYAGG